MKWKSLQHTVLGLVFLLGVSSVSAVEPLNDEYLYGLGLFKEAKYKQALEVFQTVLNDPGSVSLYGNASYWQARAYLESGDLIRASRSLDSYLTKYPHHTFNIPGQYYKGRILFLQEEYDKTIHYYSSFLTSNPRTSYYSNSLLNP